MQALGNSTILKTFGTGSKYTFLVAKFFKLAVGMTNLAGDKNIFKIMIIWMSGQAVSGRKFMQNQTNQCILKSKKLWNHLATFCTNITGNQF